MSTLRDRALGALYGTKCTHTHTHSHLWNVRAGQAIGDALGARYEFDSRARVCARVSDDVRAHDGHHLLMRCGGPFKVEPGQTTDDTALAMAQKKTSRQKDRCDILTTAAKIRQLPVDHRRTTNY